MELAATRQLVNTGPVRGEVVYVGSGAPGRELLADPRGKLALIDAASVASIQRVQEAGAVAVLSAQLVTPSGRPRPEITIPGMSLAKEAAQAIQTALQAGERVEVELVPGQASWGVVRLWDIRDKSTPVQVGTFATPSARQFPPPGPGLFLAPYAFVRGNRVYASWVTDGVRVIDIGDPTQPREVAHFVPPFDRSTMKLCTGPICGAWPAVFDVVEHDGLILAIDPQSGLWILRDLPR
jgi:hypothetical protein